MSSPDRPRRSVLYMPGANPKALDKAKTLGADALIFDLEDAVAPEAKDQARANVVSALASGGYGKREIIVRVNALTTPWGAEDVSAAVGAFPDGLLFPKVSDAADVEACERALKSAGARADLAIWVMIETPLSILNIKEIAAMSKTTRLRGLVMGTNDLAKEVRALQTLARTAFIPSLSLSVLAARAYGLTAIDGVFNDIADEAGFKAVCQQGLELGFDGKTLIHPSQIDPCNQIFAPPPDAVKFARDVIAAFAAPENAGKGVLKVNGKMTELLHLEQAQRTVALAQAIADMAQA